MTVFHWAAKHGNCEALRNLVARSATPAIELVELRTRHGRTALHVASCAGKVEAVKVLLQMRTWFFCSMFTFSFLSFFH